MVREVTLSRAIEAFLLHKTAEGRSRHTIADYRNCLGKMLTYLGDVNLRTVGVSRMREFFAYLNTDYTTTPGGCAPRPTQKVSEKTVRNIHAACSSFFTWAVAEELHGRNPMDRIQRPKGDPPPIEPYTEQEIKALLTVCDTTSAWHNRQEVTSTRRTALRDKAMILLLVDTGIRASELCRLTLANIDRITGHVEVLKGKGGKSRTVRAERSTVRAIWRYLGTRAEDLPDSAPLFASTADDGQEEEKFLSRYAVLRLLKRLGERAKVKAVNIHKFRHSFGRPFGRLVNISLDMARCQERASSPWRLRGPSNSGPVSFQGT